MFRRYVYKKPLVRLAVGLYDTWGNLVTKKRVSADLPASPKRICLVILHQIGDVVMCLPSIDAIHQLFSSSELTIITGTNSTQLLEATPWQAIIKPFDAEWQKVVRQLHQGGKDTRDIRKKFKDLINDAHPDVVLVFHPDLVANQLLAQTQVPITIGFANAGAGFCLTHPLWMAKTGHQADRNYALVRAFAKVWGKTPPEMGLPHLMTAETARSEIMNWLKRNQLSSEKTVILHPFASAATKNWLPEYWREVVSWLKEQEFEPIVIGSKQDEMLGEQWFSSLEGINQAYGQFNLAQTAALLNQARLFIGVDSGPGHIAAAVGCPTLSIFSSVNDPKRWAPLGDRGKTIVLHKPVTDRSAFPYELRDLPARTEGNPYSDKIKPSDVFEAVITLLK